MYLIFGVKKLPIFTYFLARDSAEASGFGRTRFWVVRSFTTYLALAGIGYLGNIVMKSIPYDEDETEYRYVIANGI